MKENQQATISLDDVQQMFSEKDMQILQLRSLVRKVNAQVEQKDKQVKELQQELEKCRQSNTESDALP